jgi:hypothetical protein
MQVRKGNSRDGGRDAGAGALDDSDVDSDSPLVGVAYGFVSAVSLAILLALAAVVVMPALANKQPRPASIHAAAAQNAPRSLSIKLSRQRTVVYLVSTPEEGASLDAALHEWDLEVRALGVADQEPHRVVVVQTREEILHQRIIDFGLLSAQAPGLELDVVDLRD